MLYTTTSCIMFLFLVVCFIAAFDLAGS